MDNTSFNNDLHLNYEELVAYSQGNLSNSEMHRLETHLISCDLCNDALDGIAKVDEAMLFKSLSKVRAGTSTESTASISISKKQWLAIAASVILIAVVSLVFLLIPSNQESSIAEQLPNDAEPPMVVEEKSATEEDSIDSPTEITTGDNSLLAEVSREEQQGLAKTAPEETKELVVVTDEEDIDMVSGELDDNLDMATNDSLVVLGNMAMNDSAGERFVQDGNAAARSKKMAVPMAAEAEAVEEAPVDVILSPVAEKGDRHYSRYLKRGIKYPTAAKENNVSGDVILELTINVFGSITDITVVQSLGYGCDQEAMRLVREGPKWTPGSKNDVPVVSKVQVTVPFKL
jgi:TonB family protein